MAALALTAATAVAAPTTVFLDDFENGGNDATVDRTTGAYSQTPDVSTYTVANTSGQANTTLWVRSASGFNASRNGLIDESENGGANFTDPVGSQAWAGRYSSNTGITSAFNTIGSLTLGTTITVSFDAVIDGSNAGSAINAYLVLFNGAGTRDAVENDLNNTDAALARLTGTATSSYVTYSFSYTVGNNVFDANGATAGTPTAWDPSLLGKDIAVRFKHTNGAIVDNVKVTIDYDNLSYWDTDGATAGAGGATPNGTWDAATTNWNPDPAGTGTAAAWSPGEFAVFAAGTNATGSYTVTVDGPQNIGGLLVEEGSIDFANGTSGALNLTSNSDVLVPSGSTVSIGTPITDADDTQVLQKIGTGLLVLSADNSAANGGIQVTQGAIQFESPASINGTTENVTINSGSTVLLGASFGAGNIPTALADRIVTTSAGTIAADNYAATAFDFSTPGLTAARLGAVGSVNYTGTLTPEGNTYRLGGGGGTLTMANTNALTGAGNSVVIQGNVVLAGSNDLDGGVTLGSGTLTLGNADSLGSGSLTIAGGSIAASGTVVTANSISANGNFTVVGSGALTLGGDMTVNANRTITNSNTDATTTLGNFTGTNRSLTFNGSGNTTVSGNITTGNQGLTKNNSGELRLEGANTYSGTTTVNGGKLILAGSNSSGGATTVTLFELHLASASNGGLASGNVTFGNGTQFNAVIRAVDADRVISNNLILNNTHGSIIGNQSLTVNGTFTNSGGNRTLTSSIGGGDALTLAGEVRLSENNTARSLTVTGTGETIVTGNIVNGGTGAGGLTKGGAGKLTLSGTNTYTGNTAVNTGGELALVGGSQTSAITVNSGAFVGFTPGSPTTSTAAFNLNTGHTVRINGTPVPPTSYTLITAASIGGTAATPNLESPITDYELVKDGAALKLNYTGVGGNPYDTWSGGAAANVDTNGDGVTNGVAWALGAGDPDENAIGLLPTLDNTSDPTYVIFEFERADLANDDPNTTISVEYGNDLAGWTTAVDDNDNVEIEVTTGSPTDTVVVKLKRSTLGAGGELFARLNVVVATP